MIRSKTNLLIALAVGAAAFTAGCSDSGTTGLTPSNAGTMIVRLTDAPFLADSLKSVDIYVVRVDARQSDVDDTAANNSLDDNASSADGWKNVAQPNVSFNLLDLQNGVSAVLGQANLPPGTYNGFRLVIDPSKSSVTLKGGQVLSGSTNPGVTFPSASRSGIKIVLSQPVQITAGTTTSLLVDFDVNNSFVMRGNTIDKNGLLFKPVIKATITNLALTNANVRLINATDNALNFLQNGTALSGGSNIAFGTASACSSVNAATPGLTVTQPPSTTPLAGFAPTLTAGNSFSIVSYPSASGVQFSTLSNTFAAASGQAGLRVFNGSGGATGLDVFVTAPGAALGTATFANVASGASSTFSSVAASSQIRVTATGSTTVLLDLGTQALPAVQNTTIVLAPPASGSTTLRGFLIPGC
jgi:Domain of unknown function (DUF4382)/Domain of unknown function (DUF4397)